MIIIQLKDSAIENIDTDMTCYSVLIGVQGWLLTVRLRMKANVKQFNIAEVGQVIG